MLNCQDVEERLAPYVDGAEAPDSARAIQAHLSRCAPCAERAQMERAARDLLVACREELKCQAPAGLRERCACQPSAASLQSASRTNQPGRWSLATSRWQLAAGSLAASLLLAVAVVFLFSLNRPVEALANGLAIDHVKCFKIGDTDHPGDAVSAETAWQKDRGWALQVARASAQEALELICVRQCLSTSGMTAHIMYRWHGQPLSVYVLPRAVADNRVMDAMGHETAVWSDAGRTYAVLAEGHPADFEHIVTYVKDHTR